MDWKHRPQAHPLEQRMSAPLSTATQKPLAAEQIITAACYSCDQARWRKRNIRTPSTAIFFPNETASLRWYHAVNATNSGVRRPVKSHTTFLRICRTLAFQEGGLKPGSKVSRKGGLRCMARQRQKAAVNIQLEIIPYVPRKPGPPSQVRTTVSVELPNIIGRNMTW